MALIIVAKAEMARSHPTPEPAVLLLSKVFAMRPLDVLAIGAHPDDIELGCGASLAKLARQGARIRALVLSAGDAGAADGHARRAETRQALERLGVCDLVQADLPDTALDVHRAEIIALIEAHCAQLQPDRVYTMFENDRHQDHRAVFLASIIACRRVPQVLSYETPSSWPNFAPVIFEPVGKFLEQKIASIQLHRSQGHRDYMQPAHLRSHATFRGCQIGQGPCEGFVPHKVVL